MKQVCYLEGRYFPSDRRLTHILLVPETENYIIIIIITKELMWIIIRWITVLFWNQKWRTVAATDFMA